jgi:hypothetical protein
MTTIIRRLLAFIFSITIVVRASAQENTVTLFADHNPALALRVPAAAKVTFSNDYVNIRTTNMSLHVWFVANAKTVNDAVPRAAELIKSEFIKFKASSTEDLVIAGAPAKQVTGSGNEADDGDPGHAEVVFFVVGGRVFAGCVHGEFDDASRERAPMMAVLRTARPAP